MNVLARRRLILGLALIAGVMLLGQWMMRSDDVADISPPVEATPPAPTQSPAIAESVPTQDRSSKPAFATLRGRVIDAVTRQPLREFEVQLLRTGSNAAGDEAKDVRNFRNRDGRFEWPSLPTGEWALGASAAGYQRLMLDDVRLLEGDATAEIVLALRQALAIRGRVFDEDSGAPIGNARVAVRSTGPGGSRDPVRGATTASDGTFVLEDRSAGPVSVGVGAENYAARDLDVVVGDDMPELQIGLIPGGTIAGRLVAPDGSTPVAGNVSLFELDGHSGHMGTTGPAGQFEYRHLAPGRYRLKGHAPGGRATRDITLARSERIEGLILTLKAAHSIRGVVTGLRREELSLASISLMRGEEISTEGELDDRGTFAIHGVPAGRAVVMAATEGRQVSEMVDMPSDSDLTVNLDFPRGVRLSGRITRGGEPLRNVNVSPLPPRDVQQSVYVHGTRTSDDGAYTIEDLPPGRYVLMIDSFQSGPVKVSGDTVFDFEVPEGRLSGRVLASRGKPIMGAVLFMWPDEPHEMLHPMGGSSDQSGEFTLEGLEPGEFTLTVYKSGYEMLRKHISYEPQTPELTVQLREERGVEVTAHEAVSGTPVKSLLAVEMIGSGRGSVVRVELDEDGKGYLPRALAGSTLKFVAPDCEPTNVESWNGSSLDLQFERAGAR